MLDNTTVESNQVMLNNLLQIPVIKVIKFLHYYRNGVHVVVSPNI